MFWKLFLSWLSFAAGQSTPPHRRLAAAWCELHSAGVAYSRGEYFPCRREVRDVPANATRLRGVTLRVGIIQGGDFDYDCSSDVEGGVVKPKDGYGLFLLSTLEEILQFEVNEVSNCGNSCSVKFVSSTTWGIHEGFNGTWKGLAGLLAYNRTDLTACHWTASDFLTDIADYLFATLETSEAFVYIPQNLPLTEDVFVEAFSRKLWVFFLLSIFLLVLSFWFSTYMHSRVRPDHEPWRCEEVLLWAIAAISQQSYSRHPRGFSCRTMFLIGYMIAYLFYTGFAAGITSLLALQSQQNHLTFDDVDTLKLHLLLHKDEFYRNFFQMPLLAHRHVEKTEGLDLKQIFEKIQQPNYVGFGATVTFLRYLSKEEERTKRRSYSVSSAADFVRRKAFLVRKNFPHRRLFDYWLLRLRESGLLDHGSKRYLRIEGAARLQAAIWFSAGLGNVFSALAFLSAGWMASILVLFAEILWNKKNHSKTRKEKKTSILNTRTLHMNILNNNKHLY